MKGPRTLRTTPRAKAAFLEALSRGLSIGGSCDAARIGRRTAYDLKASDPEFAAEWEAAIERGSDLIEDEAFRRAVEGTTEPVVSQGRVARNDDGTILVVRKYSDTLMTQILKARRPEKYRERVDNRHTGKDGGPITFADLSKATDEQLAALEALFGPLAGSGTGDGGDPSGERLRRKAEADRVALASDAERIRARCQTLAGFVREAWHVLEPNAAYLHGWHIDAICLHLEAITTGRFIALGLPNRLLVNVPPGTMKSLIVSVFWPAWEWGPRGLAGMRYLTTSYKEDFVKRDSRRMRDLVSSEWYRALWPEIVLSRAGEISFANTGTGNREGVAFSGLTGGRGDRVIIDDPHSTETAESVTERDRTTRIFRESVPSRLNDPKTSAIVVVMQRLHENDVSGQILKLGLGYVHLMLPMEFEPERRCATAIGFTDPRTADGDLLFPERFPRAVVERDKIPMGSYAVAGRFQQRPAPREGGLFKKSWFNIIRAAPAGCVWVRAWDLAGSEAKQGSNPAYTAGLKMGRAPDGRLIIADVRRAQYSPAKVEEMIVNTARQDGAGCKISLPQDPGSAGKSVAHYLIRQLVGFNARATPKTGDKITRAEPVSAQAEVGNISLVEAWNDAFLDEVASFPNGTFKDQVDAMSRAFIEVAKPAYGMLSVV